MSGKGPGEISRTEYLALRSSLVPEVIIFHILSQVKLPIYIKLCQPIIRNKQIQFGLFPTLNRGCNQCAFEFNKKKIFTWL